MVVCLFLDRSIFFFFLFHLAMVARPAQSLVAIMLSKPFHGRRNDSL